MFRVLITVIAMAAFVLPSKAAESATVGAVAEAPAKMWLADFAAMQRLRELGGRAENREEFADAGAYYERAAWLNERIPSPAGDFLAISAAINFVKAGDNAKAIEMLEHAAEKGFRYPDYVEGVPALAPLKDQEAFKTIITRMRAAFDDFHDAHRNPEASNLIFDDVERFWQAYDLAATAGSKSEKAAIFREQYLAPGSPGLIDYHWIKTISMERLVERIESAQGYYDGIRERTLSAAAFEDDIREGLRRLVAMYPQATVPDVTFVIGRLNSGGTAGPSGMLIGLDVWSWAEGVPLDGIEPGFQTVVQNFDLSALPFIVVHEHIHSLQQYGGERTLLLGALQEGSADLIAGLAFPDREKPHYYQWALEREEEIWRRFKQEMDGDDLSNWLGNNGADLDDDWYADLGYFVGARICELYYAQAEDKEQAIRDLLFVTDAKAILDASGYAEQFTE